MALKKIYLDRDTEDEDEKEVTESSKPAHPSERAKGRGREEMDRRRNSVTWGDDETFHYEAQTPERFRKHSMTEQDVRLLLDDVVLQDNQISGQADELSIQDEYPDHQWVTAEHATIVRKKTEEF